MKRSITLYGGNGASLALYPQSVRAQVNAVDVQAVLDKLNSPPVVGKYAIAPGETVLSIAHALGSPALLAYAEASGNSSSDDGADASRVVGDAIARFEIQHGGYEEFVAVRRNALVIEAGGNLERVELVAVAGSGGGVGGGAARRLESAAVKTWVRGGYAVHRHFVRFGPKCHTRTSDEGDHNERVAAAACCEDLFEYMVGLAHSAHETRECTFIDLPLTGADDVARAYFAATCAQALLSSELRERLMAYKVNGKNKLKRVTVAQASWYGQLAVSTIQQAAYHRYTQELDLAFRGTAEAAPFEAEIQVHADGISKEVVSVTELVDRAASTTTRSEEILAAAAICSICVGVRCTATLSRGRRVELERLEEFLNGFGPSFREFLDRRASVEALASGTQKELFLWTRKRHEAAARLKFHTLRASSILRWSFGRGGWLCRLVSASKLLSKKRPRLQASLKVVRKAATDLATAEKVTEQLAAVLVRLEEEKARVKAVICQVETCLAAFKAKPVRDEPFVEFEPLDVAWSALTAMKDDTYGENGRQLTGLVRYVTAHGLKKILGARDHNVESIVAALQTAAPVTEGPHWGGEICRRYNSTVFVLPPVSESLRQGFLGQANRDVEVLFSDGAAAGVTIVRLRLSTPREVERGGLLEVFTRSVRERFLETIQEDVRADYYPSGNDAWIWLADKLSNKTVGRPCESAAKNRGANGDDASPGAHVVAERVAPNGAPHE